ncbi:nucleotidyltransferase domain-containing protein [Candidatus Babeliales bacterium]|nr:nucleotidyltransferase domain-containing protein [Candidatus Babeliales bacterium]
MLKKVMHDTDILKYQFLKQIKQLPFVEKVILFGSRARGIHRSRSDIDIAVVCPNATIAQWLQILDIVDNADTLLTIDCVRFDTADTQLRDNILKDGVEI